MGVPHLHVRNRTFKTFFSTKERANRSPNPRLDDALVT
jgi:hypothetical protein